MRYVTILIGLIVILLSVPLSAHHHPNHVKRKLTPIDTVGLARVLRKGHKKTFGFYPSKKRLAVGWSQVALENGQGKKIYNHNLGFITSSKNRPFFIKRQSYRAHKTFLAGAADYWDIVRRMCKSSLKHFDNGQPYVAAKQLKRCGYYGADSEHYARIMQKLYVKATKRVLPKLKETK